MSKKKFSETQEACTVGLSAPWWKETNLRKTTILNQRHISLKCTPLSTRLFCLVLRLAMNFSACFPRVPRVFVVVAPQPLDFLPSFFTFFLKTPSYKSRTFYFWVSSNRNIFVIKHHSLSCFFSLNIWEDLRNCRQRTFP